MQRVHEFSLARFAEDYGLLLQTWSWRYPMPFVASPMSSVRNVSHRLPNVAKISKKRIPYVDTLSLRFW
jgi:hypothetical protein